jgi:hypothetical protein
LDLKGVQVVTGARQTGVNGTRAEFRPLNSRALKCRSCMQGRYAPPVHMIKLTETREITPYLWVHPDEER